MWRPASAAYIGACTTAVAVAASPCRWFEVVGEEWPAAVYTKTAVAECTNIALVVAAVAVVVNIGVAAEPIAWTAWDQDHYQPSWAW